MNSRLFLYLGLIGTVAGVAVYGLREGTTKGELLDAGIKDGTFKRVTVKVEGRRCTENGCRYGACLVDGAWKGRDAGLILDLPAGVEVFHVERVHQVDAGDVTPGTCVEVEPDCACRRATGACKVRAPDGGLMDAPWGVTLGPGYPHEEFGGQGCEPKVCRGLAGPGDGTWPEVCPEVGP